MVEKFTIADGRQRQRRDSGGKDADDRESRVGRSENYRLCRKKTDGKTEEANGRPPEETDTSDTS